MPGYLLKNKPYTYVVTYHLFNALNNFILNEIEISSLCTHMHNYDSLKTYQHIHIFKYIFFCLQGIA